MIDDEYKKLKKQYNKKKKQEEEILKLIEQLHKKRPSNLYEMEEKLRVLSHKYQKKDVVVLKNKQVCMIVGHIGVKMYEVQIPAGLKHSCTIEKIHQDEILCHAYDLVLNNTNVFYREDGLRS